MIKSADRMILVMLLAAMLALGVSRYQADAFTSSTQHISSPLPLLADIAMAGSVPGLAADFNILQVFSYHYAATRSQGNEQQALWDAMAQHLARAQKLDPRFYDTYRLSAALLPYDANKPGEAVAILQAGIPFQQDSWELPFLGGFIAHDMLNDDKLAFELMQQVLHTPDAPPLAIGLASRFLYASRGKRDTLLFLQGLLEMMPKAYRAGIEERIKKIKKGFYEKNQ